MRLAAMDPSPFRGVLDGTLADPLNASLSTTSGALVANLTGSVEQPFAAGSAVRATGARPQELELAPRRALRSRAHLQLTAGALRRLRLPA